MTLKESDRALLLAQLKRHEGTRRNAEGRHVVYRCPAGAWTIGYGHNLDANPIRGVGPWSTMDEAEATALLDADVRNFEHELINALPWVQSLDAVRYAVLVNMAFNLGLGGLLTFKNTLADVRGGDYATAATRMLQSKWASQVKGRATELSGQMRTGQWQT